MRKRKWFTLLVRPVDDPACSSYSSKNLVGKSLCSSTVEISEGALYKFCKPNTTTPIGRVIKSTFLLLREGEEWTVANLSKNCRRQDFKQPSKGVFLGKCNKILSSEKKRKASLV